MLSRILRWRVFDRRNVALILAGAFLLVGAVSVHNLISRNVARVHIDETTTLFLGTQFLSPWDAAPYPVHVGEMNRWLVRLLYPLGIYYMNTRMGGDWEAAFLGLPGPPGAPNPATYDGWRYPGGYYLKEKFGREDWNFAEDFELDPNVQDYVFAMRFAIGLMAILSFSLVIAALCRKTGAVAAAIYGIAVLSHSLVYSQFSRFYAETVLFLIFNLAIFLYLRADTLTHRVSVFFGVLSAAVLSTKLMGILIAAPVFVHVLLNRARKGGFKARDWRLELYVGSFTVSFVILNLWSGSLFDFVNETLANVYNYAGMRNAPDVPLRHFRTMVEDLGYPLIIFCIAIFLWMLKQWRRDLALVYVLGIVVALVVWSLSNAAIWAGRNTALPIVAMSFILALGAGRFTEPAATGVRGAGEGRSRMYSAGAVAVFLLAAAAVPAIWLPSPERMFVEQIRAETGRCGDIAAIGLSKADAVRLTGRSDVTTFERLEGPYRSSRDEGVEGVRWYEKYTGFDCLIVKRRGENKHISNYFAPLTHRMSSRVGNLFFFAPRGANAAEREEAYRAAWDSTVAAVPAASSVFDLHVGENALTLVKEPCAANDTRGYFFVRVHPVDKRDLPETRRDDDLISFVFDRYGARFDGKCMATVPLPTYGIARVEAGQTDGSVTNWEVETDFGEGPAPAEGQTP